MIIRDWLQICNVSKINCNVSTRNKCTQSMQKWDVYAEEINKIAQSSNDNERLQISGKTTTYPHGTKAFKVCESEM